MKRHLVLAICIIWGAAGCGGSDPASGEAASNSPAAGNPLTAPVDYLGAVGQSKRSAEAVTQLASIRQAIQMFLLEEDRYPTTLDELVSQGYLPRVPAAPRGMRYAYEPARGEVKLVPLNAR